MSRMRSAALPELEIEHRMMTLTRAGYFEDCYGQCAYREGHDMPVSNIVPRPHRCRKHAEVLYILAGVAPWQQATLTDFVLFGRWPQPQVPQDESARAIASSSPWMRPRAILPLVLPDEDMLRCCVCFVRFGDEAFQKCDEDGCTHFMHYQRQCCRLLFRNDEVVRQCLCPHAPNDGPASHRRTGGERARSRSREQQERTHEAGERLQQAAEQQLEERLLLFEISTTTRHNVMVAGDGSRQNSN